MTFIVGWAIAALIGVLIAQSRKRLLEEWGVTEPLPGEDLSGYRVAAHRNFPGWYVYYPLHLELSPLIITGICSWLRDLHRRSQR